MKAIKFISFCLLILTSGLTQAQKQPEVAEQMEQFGKAAGNSLTIIIPEATAAAVEKEWKSLLKVYGGKVKSSKNVITAYPVRISTMGTDTFTVHSKIISVNNGVKLIAAFESNGKYVSNYESSKQYSAAENLLYNFSVKMSKQGVSENISVAEKEYKRLERDKSRLEQKQKRLEKDIERWNDSIRKAEKEMDSNKKALEEMNKALSDKEKSLKDIEKRQKEINKFD